MSDPISEELTSHYRKTFLEHGANAKGVDWGDEEELQFRYGKMMKVLDKDFEKPEGAPSLFDVGCGWGGLFRYCGHHKIDVKYTGIDTVGEMIEHGKETFPEGDFIHGDIFAEEGSERFDYVVCNAILTQKLDVSNIEMEKFSKRMLRKMFDLARYGVACNFMSTRVNFTAPNLYYQNPSEMLAWCLSEVTPRAVLDHGYSSLLDGAGKFYDFTIYLYKR